MLPTPDYAADVDFLADLGPRPTGSPAHERLVDHLIEQLSALGLAVQVDEHRFTRWEIQESDGAVRLSLAGEDLEVSSAVPYSGSTGPAGVAGTLTRLSGPRPAWREATGRIAVVEVTNRPLPMNAVIGTWEPSASWGDVAHPLFAATFAGMGLGAARRAGVKAVVFTWRGITPENAQGQQIPFTFPYRDIPAVFVAGAAAERVLDAARQREEATLVLDAVLDHHATTRTLWATLEGTSRPDETVLVVTHTDGTNAVEENGHIGVLALARDAVAGQLDRTMVFVLVTGHLRMPALSPHGQATTRWLADHPDWWAGGRAQRRAVAGLVIEHLGAVEMRDDPIAGTYLPTGRPEPELLYATTAALKDIVIEAWPLAVGPPLRVARPTALVHFGEGEPLHDHGIPAVALVTAPQYLLAEWHGDDRQLIDLDHLTRQVDAFRELLVRLDRLPRSAFGTVRRATPAAKVVAGARAVMLAAACILRARFAPRRRD